MESIPAADACVVCDVAGRLFEVRHEPTPLEHLGEEVRGLFTGKVHATELRDGVVAILEEHLVVELLGPPKADGGVDARIATDVELADELIEEQPTQALRRARIPGEQGALDDLGEVDEREHRAVEIREIAPQDVGLFGVELLCDVHAHEWRA